MAMNQRKNGLPKGNGASQSHNKNMNNAQTHARGLLQPKTDVAAQKGTLSVAPPAYRPQPASKALQPKTAHVAHPPRHLPAAPSVCRPQPVPRVLQTKTAQARQPQEAQTGRQPVAPPVYRPELKKSVQPKMAAPAQAPKMPKAPPMYRPQSVPKVLQAKKSIGQQTGQGQREQKPFATPARINVLSSPTSRLVIQRKPVVNVQIAGVTHLKEASVDGSLVRGTDYAEVEYPETVTVDKGDIWDSHLGINLQVSKDPVNVWYRVVAYKGNLLNHKEVYVRAEMIEEHDTPTASVEMLKMASAAQERAKKKGAFNDQLLYQSLGDVWEAYLWPLMVKRRGGSTVYWNLRHGKAELDFVFVTSTSVKIVSAKISRKAFSPKTDKEHWAVIKANWEAAKSGKNAEWVGVDFSADQLPDGEPVVVCESLETQGMDKSEFEALLKIKRT